MEVFSYTFMLDYQIVMTTSNSFNDDFIYLFLFLILFTCNNCNSLTYTIEYYHTTKHEILFYSGSIMVEIKILIFHRHMWQAFSKVP